MSWQRDGLNLLRCEFLRFVMVMSLFVLVACDGQNDRPQTGNLERGLAATSEIAPKEGLSDEDLTRIDAAPESSLPDNKIILPNGENLESYANRRHIRLH